MLIEDKKSLHMKQIRKNQIEQFFKDNKLIFKNYGDTYSYINYNKPTLDEIYLKEIERIKIRKYRRQKLGRLLKKINIPLDETLQSCYNYVNNIGTKKIDDIVRGAEIEYFLKYKTNYEELKKQFTNSQAQDIAISEFNKKNTNNNKIATKKHYFLHLGY